ncbi:MAG: hypothetical protein H7Y37_07420 [Anaerolineae bacterium]|nr:hypothetical protein [Gloeobacterales cyanobacterium ES-bin-313]
MQLPKGVTGFYGRGEAEPPTVDTKQFTAVCHYAVRSIGGKVLKIDTAMIYRNYCRADIQFANGTLRQIVCNTYHPLIAIGLEAQEGEFYPHFVDEPALAAALSALGGFEVLNTQVLDVFPDTVNTALLGKAEREQVNYWKPDTIGKILFNHWD